MAKEVRLRNAEVIETDDIEVMKSLIDKLSNIVIKFENKSHREDSIVSSKLEEEYVSRWISEVDHLSQKLERNFITTILPVKSKGKVFKEDWSKVKEQVEKEYTIKRRSNHAEVGVSSALRGQVEAVVLEIVKMSDNIYSHLQPIQSDMDYVLPGLRIKIQQQLTSIVTQAQMMKVTNPKLEDLARIQELREAALSCKKTTEDFIQHTVSVVIRQREDESRQRVAEEEARRIEEEAEKKRQLEKEEMDKRKEIEEEERKRKHQEALTARQKSSESVQQLQATAVDGNSVLLPASAQPVFHGPASYDEAVYLVEEFEAKVKELKDTRDSQLKKYAFNIRKMVSGICSQMTGSDEQRLVERFQILLKFMKGHPVRVHGTQEQIAINGHPLGGALAWFHLFHSVIAQGEKQFAENMQTAPAFASVIATVIGEFREYQILMLAYFFVRCPLLAPFFPTSGSSNPEKDTDALLKRLGYQRDNPDTWESQTTFLSRCQGLARLYAALMVTRPIVNSFKKSDQFSSARLWTLLAILINKPIVEGVTAQVVRGVLELAGPALLKYYKIQFVKLLSVAYTKFSSNSDITSISLTAFIEDLIKSPVF